MDETTLNLILRPGYLLHLILPPIPKCSYLHFTCDDLVPRFHAVNSAAIRQTTPPDRPVPCWHCTSNRTFKHRFLRPRILATPNPSSYPLAIKMIFTGALVQIDSQLMLQLHCQRRAMKGLERNVKPVHSIACVC